MVVTEGRHIVMPESLLKQALKQFHNDHMGIKKRLISWHINQSIGKIWMLIFKSI